MYENQWAYKQKFHAKQQKHPSLCNKMNLMPELGSFTKFLEKKIFRHDSSL